MRAFMPPIATGRLRPSLSWNGLREGPSKDPALHGQPYLVFHDAYHYFELRFGLSPVGAVTVAPDRPVGPRRVEAMRRAILDGRVGCVFSEPQFSPRLVETLIEGSRAKTGTLDPLGASLAPGPDLYPRLLRGLSVSLNSCLGNIAKNR